jgi:hypothetical protein
MEVRLEILKRHLRPYCLKELAALYEVKPRTIKMWLEPFSSAIGKKIGRFYTIRQVHIIFSKIGDPDSVFPAQ